MPTVKPRQAKDQLERIVCRLPTRVIERLRQRAIMLEEVEAADGVKHTGRKSKRDGPAASSIDHVVAEALTIFLERDRPFAQWIQAKQAGEPTDR